MPVMRACLNCGALVQAGWPHCSREARRVRPTREARGYDWTHRKAREQLKGTLPDYCGYDCGAMLQPDGDWVAAHRVDGSPDAGWLASCRSCNERAKVSRGGR